LEAVWLRRPAGFRPTGPPMPEAGAGRRGSSEDDLPLRCVALRTLATDGV
jgi:hypothetical protein